jgi:hypothetical protein
MDSLDLFKKLTTNLSFAKKPSSGQLLKRKLEENEALREENGGPVKLQKLQQPEPPKPSANKKAAVNKKGKKKDLLKITEEQVCKIRKHSLQ